MQKHILLLLLFITGIISYSQNTTPKLIPFRKGDLWGYCDSSKNTIVPYIYYYVSEIKFGVGIIKNNHGFGMIDSLGNIIVDCQYDYLNNISKDGMLCAIEMHKYGFINLHGDEIIPMEYENLFYFNQGFAKVKKNGKYGVINKKNQIIIPIEYDRLSITAKNGYVCLYKNDKCGFADTSGKMLTPCIYDYYFVEDSLNKGFAQVKKGDKKYYLNLKTTKEIDITHYRSVSVFRNGLAIARDSRYSLIDTNGNHIPNFVFSYIQFFNNDTFKVMKNNRWGLMDIRGNIFSDFMYKTIRVNASKTFMSAKKGGKFGYIDASGKVIIPFIYTYASNFSNGQARVKDKHWKYIDSTGKEIIAFNDYDFITDFSEDMVAVKKGGKWGLTDRSGKVIVPVMHKFQYYKYINRFYPESVSGGIIKICEKKKYGLYNMQGTIIAPFIFDFIDLEGYGLAKVRENELIYFIDANGNKYYEP